MRLRDVLPVVYHTVTIRRTQGPLTRMRLLHTAAALAVTALSALSAVSACGQKPALPELKHETYTLPNGLKVITHEDHRLPLVAVDLWYHVGPLNERPGRTGFAHLFEHMMFEGSEHVGEKAHFKYVEAAGATDINGTTSFDRTNYFETLPANQLELGMWLESDRMGFLMEGLDRTKLANQRDVVRNERRQGEGTPYDLAEEKTYQLLFPAGHPYYGNVIGSHADIEAARIADIRDFHQQFYTPNNASIAIAGDFNPAQLRALLTKYFGPIPKGPEVAPVNVVTPAITAQRRATVTDSVKLSQIDIGFLTPAIYTPGDKDIDVDVEALTGGRAGRLTQVPVNQTQVAQTVRCGNDSEKLTGILQCQITAKPGVKLEDLEATFWKEIGKLQAEGPTADEVEAAKAVTLTRKITGLQRLGGFGGVADTLDQYNQYTGDPGYLPHDVAALEAVTPASAKAAAVKYLNQNQAVVVYTVPGAKVVNDVPRSPDSTDADVKITNPYTQAFEDAQAFRKTPPAPGAELTFHLPTPKTFTLANGLKVYVVEDHNLPVVSAQLSTRAGGENNPPDKAGLASFNALVMGEATKTRDLTRLAQDQQRLGTTINLSANVDSARVSLTVTTDHTGAALDLLADIVQHPAFKPEDIERLRKRRLTAIAQEADSPQTIGTEVGHLLLFGQTPYGQAAIGTIASVTALTPADLTGFYEAHFGPADSALSFAGDLTEAQAKAMAVKYFGSWSAPTAPAVTLPSPPAAPTRHIVIIDKPGSPQTFLAAYGLGHRVDAADDHAIDIMDFTLGGAFTSRINMDLREQHGYTYGASAYYPSYRQGGFFIADTLVRTDVTGAAATALFYELKRFPANPPTPAEIKSATDSSIESIPATFETTAATADAEGRLFVYNRPLDYYATLPAAYRAVTPGDIARVAREDVHPDNLIIVAVGDRAKIEPGLKAANLGPIEHRTVTGELIP